MKQRKPINVRAEELVDRGTAAVAEVHKEIARLPFDAAERLDPLAAPARKAREVHDGVVDLIYGSVRNINHAVWHAAGVVLGLERPAPARARTAKK